MYKIVIMLLLSCLANTAHGQCNWKLKKDEAGIKVYTAHNTTSDVKRLKVECTVQATMEQLMALLLDVNRQSKWVYNTRMSRILQMPNPSEVVFYSQVNVPWPCTDRDYILDMQFKKNDDTHITIDSHASPDWMPSKNGFVRVRHSNTHWDIVKLSDNELKIEYTLDFNPGDAVPAWLVNLFLTTGPCQSFRKLRENVKKPEYQNAHIPFLGV